MKLTIKRHFYGISRYIAGAVHGDHWCWESVDILLSLARRDSFIKECVHYPPLKNTHF